MTRYESLLIEYDEETIIEELVHYHTSVGDILNQDSTNNIKQELKARGWAVDKRLPFEDFLRAYEIGCRTIDEVADFLDLDEAIVFYSIEHYEKKMGIEFPIDV